MGGSGSKQSVCLCLGIKKNCSWLKRKKRRRRRRREAGAKNGYKSNTGVDKSQSCCYNATFQESRLDPATALESDDDYHSVQDAFTEVPQISTDYESASGNLSPLFKNRAQYDQNSGLENATLDDLQDKDKPPISLNKIATPHNRDDSSGELFSCGLLSSSCLPCLVSSPPLEDKLIPSSSSPLSTRKKAALKVTFFGRNEHTTTPSLSLPKALLRRPVAGTQVPLCPLEKVLSDSWSPIEPSVFKVRGLNYLRDKKKEFASNFVVFYPFGVDVFLSPRKIDHIARFVDLPHSFSSANLPSILVVNLQIPLYPATFFNSENDGDGMSFVLYFKLSANYSKELPLHFLENFRRLINDEVERVKGFPRETVSPFRERLKILGRVVNIDDLQLSTGERKLMSAYNEKPVLSRPQHEFYLGENYLEIDLDMHRFGFIPRKGFQSFQERLKQCIMDFGLTIQGDKAEDLPENLLCCVRLNEIDYKNYNQLGI